MPAPMPPAPRSSLGFTDAPRAAANAAAQAVAWQIPHQRDLGVVYIVPRNQGDRNDLSNLQALCFRCNAGKRTFREMDFVFCTLEGSGLAPLKKELMFSA